MDVEVKGEKGQKRVEHSSSDAEEVREILTVVSDKVPALVKGLVTSVFSEDAARGMGKAAASYYQELKAGGLPDEVAVQMTKEYVGTFTKVSEMFKSASRGGFNPPIDLKVVARDRAKKEEDEDKEED